MERFMDTVFQKRYSFLELLAGRPFVTQEELTQELDISLPTLHSTAELIRHDFHAFDDGQSIQLLYNPTMRGYSLTVSDHFSLLLIRLFYYDHSLRFQLLQDLLYASKKSIQELADTHHTTYSTISRELKYLQPQLADLGFSLVLRKGVRLEGDELAIRLFFSSLYQNVYGSYKWPFPSVTQKEIISLLNTVPTRIFRMDILDKHVSTYFFTAISLIRNGKFTDNTALPLYETEDPRVERQLNQALQTYQHLVSGLSEKEAQLELQLLCSVLLANGSYEGISRVPLFFITSDIMKKTNFFAKINHIADRVNYYLLRELTEKEFQLLIYKLSLIYYRIELFGPVLLSDSTRWSMQELEENQRNTNRIKMIKYIAQSEFPSIPLNYGHDYSDYLINQIYASVFRTVDKSAYQIEIKILLFSVTTTQRLKAFLKNSFGRVFNLSFVNRQDTTIDLIISDSPFSKTFFPFITDDPPVIYTGSSPDSSDLEKISTNLANISFEKYCELKGIDTSLMDDL